MATNRTNERLVFATFSSSEQAENAIDQMHAAGITSDQIRYSRQFTSEDFLSGIKDLLIFPNERQDEDKNDVRTMLLNMGIGPDEIQYYENTFRSGNSVVVVRPDEKVQEAKSVLQKNGGSSYTQQS